MTLRKTGSAVAAAVAVMIAGGAAQAQNCMEVLDRTPEAGRFRRRADPHRADRPAARFRPLHDTRADQ